jgi:IPT/TIG domain
VSLRAVFVGAASAALAALATCAAGSALATTSVTLYAEASNGSGSSSCQSGQAVCTLGQAIAQAEALSGDAVTIDLAAGTYESSDYDVDSGSLSSLTLAGAGDASTILDGAGTNIPLETDVAYDVTVENLALQHGNAGASTEGAELWQRGAGETTIENAIVNGGTGPSGSALVEAYMSGGLQVIDTTIENGASVDGVVLVGSEEASIIGSTFTNFSGSGLGVYTADTTGASISDSTFTNSNIAIFDDSTGDDDIGFSTFQGNSYDLDMSGAGETMAATSDIFADSCSFTGSSLTDSGYNVAASGCVSGVHDRYGLSAAQIGLGSLAANGGPTQTEAIGSSSQAYDFVPAGDCTTGTDQRGIGVPQSGASGCDAGAYQYGPPELSYATPSSGLPGSSVTLTGVNLIGVTSVSVNGVAATITAQSDSQITITIPAVAAGASTIAAHGPDGSATTAFTVSSPPSPLVTLSGLSVAKRKGTATVTVSCADAACAGSLSLTTTKRKSFKRHGHKHHRLVSVTLASASYSLTVGQSAPITLTLDAAGRRAAKHASRKHPLALKLVAKNAAGTILFTLSSKLR